MQVLQYILTKVLKQSLYLLLLQKEVQLQARSRQIKGTSGGGVGKRETALVQAMHGLSLNASG